MLDRSTGAARDGRPRSPGPEMTGTASSEGIRVAKLDRLLMRADINRVEVERPDLDHVIVRGLYEHFVDVQGRQPALDEFRDYVDRITSSIEWLDLFEQFSPHAPSIEEQEAFGRQEPAEASPDRPQPQRARRGRPKGTRSASREQIIDAYRTFRDSHQRKPTQAQLAANLRPPIAPRTLQDLLREYRLPWPLE